MNIEHVDAGHHLEQRAGDIERRADAAGRQVDLARIGLGIGDEFRNRFRRHRKIDVHDQRNGGDARHRRGVADEVEIQMLIKRGIDRVRRHGQQQRVAIRRRLDDQLGADVGAGARPIFNDERLTELFRQPLADQPPDDVGRTSGRHGHDHAHRPRRISLRPRDARQCGQRHGADASCRNRRRRSVMINSSCRTFAACGLTRA